MSLFNITWRKYGLRDNPYFLHPLAIQENMPFSSFIGRKDEIERLIGMINMGVGRFLIVGDAGVGKTTLLNYVRSKASEGRFFTPQEEIELNCSMSGQQFIIETLSTVYREINRQNIILSQNSMTSLENLNSLSKLSGGNIDEDVFEKMSYERLKTLFKSVMSEIAHPRFKGIILHYDNLDNIKNRDEIKYLMGQIRDLFLIPNVIFFFVGGKFLPEDIGYERRVRQTFHMPPLEVPELSFEDAKKILEERINFLRLNEEINPQKPHTDEALKILFNLHSGNLRDTLNSLYACVMELGKSNIPIQLDEVIMRRILTEKVEKEFLSGLTQVERELLQIMLDYKRPITPTELSKLSKKANTNVTSKYLPKLKEKSAIEFIGKDGRNTYYKVAPEIMWLKLKKDDNKYIEEKKDKEIKEIESKLSDFT
ncbi:MAG: AAA family ATPase [Nanoarchaeota archaeon]